VKWEEPLVQESSFVHSLTPEIAVDHVPTDFSYSISGSSIAISYGRYDHSNWCLHAGQISVFNLTLRDFDPRKPHFTTEASVFQL
jgi:hypothetical protein